jgi:hypothetical protein
VNTLKVETLPVGSSRLARCLFVIAAGLGVSHFALSTALADGDVVTAVSSQVSSDYVRKRLPDGSIEPETYTFGKGGHLAGTMRDDSVDKLDFMDLAKTIAVPLASRQYVPATDKDPNATHLLRLAAPRMRRIPRFMKISSRARPRPLLRLLLPPQATAMWQRAAGSPPR